MRWCILWEVWKERNFPNVLMRYSSLRYETLTRDLLNIIIRTATFVVCALTNIRVWLPFWIKNDPTKDQNNTALGGAQSTFCSEDSNRGVSAGEIEDRLCGVRFHSGKWDLCWDLTSQSGVHVCEHVLVTKCGDIRRQTMQKTTLKSWLMLSTIRCSVTMIQMHHSCGSLIRVQVTQHSNINKWFNKLIRNTYEGRSSPTGTFEVRK
jgi:hypothetical protein